MTGMGSHIAGGQQECRQNGPIRSQAQAPSRDLSKFVSNIDQYFYGTIN